MHWLMLTYWEHVRYRPDHSEKNAEGSANRLKQSQSGPSREIRWRRAGTIRPVDGCAATPEEYMRAALSFRYSGSLAI